MRLVRLRTVIFKEWRSVRLGLKAGGIHQAANDDAQNAYTKETLPKMKIFIQMSNAGRVCGSWTYQPSDDERRAAYSAYLSKDVDVDATKWSAWIEELDVHDRPDPITNDCKHHRAVFLQGARGSGGREHSDVCADCGQFHVFGDDGEGHHFNLRFSLWSSAALIAASQSYRRLQTGKETERQRVWKPLDFGQLRLYKAVLSWEQKGGRRGREHYIVAADSPNQTPHSAANLIKQMYAESYDGNPQISHWDVKGYALNVLQPLEWTENGIVLLNEELLAERNESKQQRDDLSTVIERCHRILDGHYGESLETTSLETLDARLEQLLKESSPR